MAVSLVAIADFIEDLGKEVHNLTSDTIMIALSNTAPASESSDPTATGNGTLSNVTAIAYTNYADDLTVDRTMENVTWSEASGVTTFDMDDFQISASGGTLADFRYIYVYNDTSASDSLIRCIDLGETVSLGDGDSRDITLNASGLLAITDT